ncbi:MAG TPA: aspartate 1-decarboxylase [Armatimonadetes bacterium]|nr:aspartate 1-decarboxylase [Armatimonadota bacterium]
MLRTFCRAKIHRATITEADLNYVGSVTVDAELLRAADLLPYEKVSVVNVANGARFETYLIAGPAGSGTIALNGAAARLGHPGDLVIIIAYAQLDTAELADFRPAVVHVDAANRITAVRRPDPADLSGGLQPEVWV